MLNLNRIFLSFLALGVLYANVAVILNPRAHKLRLPSLPISETAFQTFLIFGVFSSFETSNQELTIWGLAKNEIDRTYWKQLLTTDYFPFTRGEQNSRMWASLHFDTLARDDHFRTWQALGRNILDRHNREYPHDPITQVGFQSKTWPRDPSGFHSRFSNIEGEKEFWVLAENK